MEPKDFLIQAVKRAKETMQADLGGPFGAVLVDRNQQVFVDSNTVLGSHDPTAHAEVNVIRQACKANNSHDLTGSVLYTTCYPCPMCLSACIWANIKDVYYGCTAQDAQAIGFRDDFIYRFINEGCKDESVLQLHPSDRDICLPLFTDYATQEKSLY
ncbi:MAG: nucleoside deaminase [Sphaerochaeta sp.]|jgi:guanine deaminase|uniref:nucleoside deaminase n=1 Tax=Sphaerochaeta sp. TaxID=1972642 RepID=UPI002FCB1237